MTDLYTLPFVEDGLLRHLDRAFPNTLPLTELSQFELGKKVGQAYVVTHLRARQKEQLAATQGIVPNVLKQA